LRQRPGLWKKAQTLFFDMKICILSTSTTAHTLGGTEIQAEALAAEASRLGHSVLVLTSASPAGLEREMKDGYEVRYLSGTHHSMTRHWVEPWYRESAAAIARLRAEKKIDVVWAENFSGLSYARLPPKDRAPLISIANGLAIRGELSSHYKALSGPADLAYFLTFYAAQLLFYYIPWFRAMARDSDLIAAVSRETAEAFESELPDSRGKTEVMYNPVDCSHFHPDPELRRRARKELGIAPESVVILMAGVMHRQKGMHIGLTAFAELAAQNPGALLLMAGDGPERPGLENIATRAGLSGRVRFLGLLPNSGMPYFYNAADIYLNPTTRAEGFGIVNAEAMACALPCIISRTGGTASTIDDAESGYFSEPGDAASIAGPLLRLAGDSALRADFGRTGRAKAVKIFDKKVVVGRYIEASERLLTARSARQGTTAADKSVEDGF